MNTDTVAPPQGIMTDEAGAITGDVTITTTETSQGTHVAVAYVGAKDTYTVTGGPLSPKASHEDVVSGLIKDTGAPTTCHDVK